MNGNHDFADFLETVPAFSEFTSYELSVLERSMVVDQYPDGYVFLDEGRHEEFMYLIIDGEVSATHKRLNARGHEEIECLGPGDLIGLVAPIDHRPCWATYIARGPVTAAYLPVPAFELLFTAHAPLGHHFQALIARQLAKDLRFCIQELVSSFANSRAAKNNKV